jgi:PAS domain S-box-containing protein
MDYLVFAIGLLLASAAVGAGFLYRKERYLTRWPALALGFIALALAGWLDLVLFVSSSDGAMPLIRVGCGVLATAAFGCFFVRPLDGSNETGGFFKRLLLPASVITALAFGGLDDRSLGFFIPVGLAAFGAGWEIGNRWARQRIAKFSCGLMLAFIALTQMIPGAVETAFEIGGMAEAWPRMLTLLILSSAAVFAATISWLVWTIWSTLAVRRDEYRLGMAPLAIVAAFIVVLVYGAFMAQWLGAMETQEKSKLLLSAVQLGAATLDPEQISKIKGFPEEVMEDPFRSQHVKLKWISKALPSTRYVYVIGKRNGRLVFLADAEDPSQTKTFSPPGMLNLEHPRKWERALNGVPHFGGPDEDRWGVWYTAIIPIKSQVTNEIVGALGVDYPAKEWLKPIATRRLAAMGVSMSVSALLLAGLAFNLLASEKNRHVDVLSERLTDAMDAAELDTWEWFPETGRLTVGKRLAGILGYQSPDQIESLLQVWRHIHPAERYHLRRMLKRSAAAAMKSSEAEIRLQDAKGNYIWFMVRGRVVQIDDRKSVRMTGTILNIDSSYLARLEIEKQRRFALRVMESVPTGVAVIKGDGIIRYANPAFATLSERWPQNLPGTPIAELIPDAEALGPEGTEVELLSNSGQSVVVQAFRSKLQEVDEQSGSIVSVIDLTSIKAAETELKQSRAEARRLALVAKRTDHAVVITDPQGRVEWVNEGFTRATGFTFEEVSGSTLGNILQGPGTDEDIASRNLIRKRIEAGLPFDTLLMNQTKSGRLYYGHTEGQPLLGRNGELTGFMSIERDVTRERRSARLLEAVSSISSMLLSSAKVADDLWPTIVEQLGQAAGVERSHMIRCSPNSQSGELVINVLASWNLEQRFGVFGPELNNRTFREIGLSSWVPLLMSATEITGPVSEYSEEVQAALTSRGIKSVAIIPVSMGNALWGALVFASCVEDRVWEPWEIGLLRSASANIGLRLVAEAESDALRSARDEAHNAAEAAERANRAKSTFLATMSHEIRTPLNAVIGMASLLETTELTPQQKDHAETILRSSHFLLELINDILDYSRIESGRIELEQSPFLIAEVCKGVFDVVRGGALDKRLEVICHIDPALPRCFRGDVGRVRQILVNLLGNAMKFTSEGFVKLLVKGKPTGDGSWTLQFDVADSGIGIAPESLERLFMPFTQEDSSTTRRFGGSGLGLAICKRLADLMGGDVTATSKRGEGSVFTLTLTLEAAPEIAPSAEPPAALPQGWDPKVLIVDDNDLNRRILEEILASLGIRCQAVESASSALQRWEQEGHFDIVLTDYHMPEMDGAELTRQLRARPDSKDTRFVLLGSDSLYGAEVRDLFDSVGTKPIWPAALVEILKGLSPAVQTPEAQPKIATDECLGKLRVLVAEDNPNNQKVIRLLLKQLGIQPDLVGDGLEAISAVASRPYDVVLMDVQMPKMDGLEATRWIRHESPQRSLFIIALTANAFKEDREAVLEAGMNRYLPKPITLAGLRSALSEAAFELSATQSK